MASKSTMPVFALKSATKRKRDPTNDTSAAVAKRRAASRPAATVPVTSTTAKDEEDTKDSKEGYKGDGRFAPKRKAPRKTKTAPWASKEDVETRVGTQSSEWYQQIDMKAKYSRSDLHLLGLINMYIKNWEKAYREGKPPTDVQAALEKVRTQLQQMETRHFISGVLVKRSSVLEPQGLPRLFDDTAEPKAPFDIAADARALYNRWMAGDIDPHLLRGIKTVKGRTESGLKRTTHLLDSKYPFKKDCYVVGHNGLTNGQWWPSRVCAVRDGAHAELEAGIAGKKDFGAYSVVVSSGGYADRDEGETIYYCGTESSDSKPTRGTTYLLASVASEEPIRVLRGANKDSVYAPSSGLRYDGLYIVTDYEVLRKETAMYRFVLRRIEGQDPIRYRGPEQRPNAVELERYARLRELLGMVVV